MQKKQYKKTANKTCTEGNFFELFDSDSLMR